MQAMEIMNSSHVRFVSMFSRFIRFALSFQSKPPTRAQRAGEVLSYRVYVHPRGRLCSLPCNVLYILLKRQTWFPFDPWLYTRQARVDPLDSLIGGGGGEVGVGGGYCQKRILQSGALFRVYF